MKKPVTISLVIATIVLAVGGLLFAQQGSDSKSDKTTSMKDMHEVVVDDSNMKPTDSSSSSEAVATSSVVIKDFAFSPANITVKVGTKVTWTNQDDVQHDVVSDDGSSDGPNGDLLSKGQNYSFTFTKAGTYKYHCSPHPYMKGTVTVSE